MASWLKQQKKNLRLWVQIAFAALTNGYVTGFLKGRIYSGPFKQLCVPGLNCYSCPGAVGACPIGALQAVLGSSSFRFSLYVFGFLAFVGTLAGRFVCGWLCPFGLVQDLLYKLPFPRKLRRLPGDRFLKFLRYVFLAVFVILLPLVVVDFVGQGKPWFCSYVCPSGTLFGGIPLVWLNEGLRRSMGWLYAWKMALLVLVLVLSVLVNRPFCRYACPLGAVYGLFNPIALYRFQVDASKCTHCGACQAACKLDIPVWKTPNSTQCIRCGACLKACRFGALRSTFSLKKPDSSFPEKETR